MEPKLLRYSEIEPMVFPSDRETRVYAGPKGLPAQRFALGYVDVLPGGSVPLHHHEQEEIYFLLEGEGEIDIDGKKFHMDPLSAVYIPSNKPHGFRNVGDKHMKFVFIYSPGGVVSHWKEEMETDET